MAVQVISQLSGKLILIIKTEIPATQSRHISRYKLDIYLDII